MRSLGILASVLLAACGGARAPSSPSPSPRSSSAEPSLADRDPPPPPNAPRCPQGLFVPSDPSAVLVTLRRTACFGWCPVYELAIYRDGRVEYRGTQFVKTCAATGQLDRAQLAALESLLARAHYPRLRDAYTHREITDAPTVYTAYAPVGGEPKQIAHYLGDSTAPRALTDLEGGIDRLVDIAQWIGSPEERFQIYADQMHAP